MPGFYLGTGYCAPENLYRDWLTTQKAYPIYSQEALVIHGRLAEIDLTDLPKEDLRKIAIRGTADGETIRNEPFEVQPDMVADAIMAADAMGRAWQ